VEQGVVKPRVAATDEGKLTDAEIRQNITAGVEQLRKFLIVIENAMSPEGYVFGEKLTWADFFLYPLLADLQAIPEGELLSERLKKWMVNMDELDAVKATKAGTLSVGARPP
jgi:glutathione S-transferase